MDSIGYNGYINKQEGIHSMTNAKLIQQARKFLNNGHLDIYLSHMNSALRSSMSTRTTNEIKSAVLEDQDLIKKLQKEK